ncbi:hypothetical protein [Kineosporia sp. NBRC 101731]|uniref:hypothetical protein n=1 Tax=Kineosporia sp. NBRC 101731 TaxID=3032199 RepID=UPI00249FE8C2|nr:hypothetical protein [Kineosporia sp. NBRC 101731]GLY32680.1 hypothetical protein Kisp02_60450 [Kineosporia sp. NBRC 101731]
MSATEPRHLSDDPTATRPPRVVAPTPKQVVFHLFVGLLVILQLSLDRPIWAQALWVLALLCIAYCLYTDVRDYRATRKAG